MSLRFNSCGNVDCLCLNHTKAPEYSMSDQRRANAVPLSKLAPYNFQPAHKGCNNRRGNKLIEEARNAKININ